MALNNSQELNYEGLSSDSGVPARTIEGHIEVLKDTLIAFELLPYTKTQKRKAVTRSKFYYFDTGIANFLAKKLPLNEGATDLGASFEQFIINEVRAYLSYRRKQDSLSYWRSRDKEVDLINGKKIEKFMIVGRFPKSGVLENIRYLNYEIFLQDLWIDKLGL